MKQKEKKLDMLSLDDGIYFNEKGYGKLHLLKEETSVYGDKEFVYEGRIHKGEVTFIAGKTLSETIPLKGEWDYGYTLEGLAIDFFRPTNTLLKKSDIEHRTFVYTNPRSKLTFVGDYRKIYRLHVRIFDALGESYNYRWLVLYLEEVR